jgi:hypothetical protein
MKRDAAIDTLLDLNGSILDQGNGYWIKLEAWSVEVSEQIPHGIRYALTLHEPYGRRILGYDNAHAVKPPKKFKYVGRILSFDHKHRHVSDKGVPYEFKDAQQLLEDFFADADRVLVELSNPCNRSSSASCPKTRFASAYWPLHVAITAPSRANPRSGSRR